MTDNLKSGMVNPLPKVVLWACKVIVYNDHLQKPSRIKLIWCITKWTPLFYLPTQKDEQNLQSYTHFPRWIISQWNVHKSKKYAYLIFLIFQQSVNEVGTNKSRPSSDQDPHVWLPSKDILDKLDKMW